MEQITTKQNDTLRLYNFDPRSPHFYIVNLGFTGVYIIFFLILLKKNIDCRYLLEPPCQLTMVNEPSVFELFRFDCNLISVEPRPQKTYPRTCALSEDFRSACVFAQSDHSSETAWTRSLI